MKAVLRQRRAWLTVFLLPAITAAASDVARRALLLDAHSTIAAVVAVGERGTVLRSTDQARSWSTVATGVYATLTAVSFADSQHGWVVGHDGLILATVDGGRSWSKQWASDQPTDSFLDVLALDNRRVIAIGAYGLYAATTDGGRNWQRRAILEDDYHLNRISRAPAGELFIAGESGTLLHSRDDGNTWERFFPPYDGSFYGILPLGVDTLIAYGLRGHVFRSEDRGRTWEAVDAGTTGAISTGLELPEGGVVLAGQVRGLLLALPASPGLQRAAVPITAAIAELVLLEDGAILAVGEAGATRIERRELAGERR